LTYNQIIKFSPGLQSLWADYQLEKSQCSRIRHIGTTCHCIGQLAICS